MRNPKTSFSKVEQKYRKKIKVVLIQPPQWAYNLPPLGVAYLTGMLRHEGLSVKVYDFNRHFFYRMNEEMAYRYRQMDTGTLLLKNHFPHWEFNFDRVQTLPPPALEKLKKYLSYRVQKWAKKVAQAGTYLCFSVHNTSLAFSQMLAQEIRVKYPEKIIIFGGPEIQSTHAPLLREGLVDYFIQGEGEEVLLQLLLELAEGKKNPTPYRGLTYYQGETLIEGHGNTSQTPIDEIPFPDFSDFFLRDYNYYSALPLLSSRSCVARCTFCAEPSYWGAFRQRDPQNIIQEIQHHYKRYKIQIYYFCDSLINGSIPWLTNFATQLKASP
jgi:hypothetical protein